MLPAAILKPRDKIMNSKLGKHREREVAELESAALRRFPAAARLRA
jgi:hypothetical protein